MILRRSSYGGEMAISDDSEPDFLNFSNDTNKVAPFRPSVSLLLLRKLKPYLQFSRRVAFKCGV